MPRKKVKPKFKYTVRIKDKNKVESLYVKYPVKGQLKPKWRKCEIETQEEVNRIIADLVREHSTDTPIPTRCDKFFVFWMNLTELNVSERTHKNRASVIRLFLTPALGYFELREVRPVQLAMIYQKMVKDGYKAEYIKKIHSAAFSIFKEAVNLELIHSNPVERARPPKTESAADKIKVLKLNEIERFREQCKTSPRGLIFEFALETGMRPQEYLGLQWADIDFKRRTVKIERGLVSRKKDNASYYFKSPKTKGSRRTLKISEQLIEKLDEHKKGQEKRVELIEKRILEKAKPSREYRKEHNRKILENYVRLNLVFPSEDFSPLRGDNLNKRYFKPIAEKIGLDESVSLYSLRHTSISLMLNAGVNPKKIAERAGHSDIAFTLNTYAHLINDEDSEASDKLSEFLYPPK